jgi:hypothetical protein
MIMTSRSSLAVRSILLASILGGALAVACTSITDVTGTQCRSEEDCRSRGPEFAETTCSAARVCVPVAKENVACSSNQQCSDANGGAPFRCLKATGLCVPLTSADCPRIQGTREDYLNDNAIFYGVLSQPDINGTLKESIIDLAREQINKQNIPSATPGGPPRPLVGVVCSGEITASGLGSSAGAIRATRHLTEVVKVAGMVGPDLAPTLLDTFNQYLKPNSVITFQTNSASRFTPDVSNGLIVSMIGGVDAVPFTTAGLMRDYVEQRTLTEVPPIRAASEPLKVAYLWSSSAQTDPVFTKTVAELRFNNLPARENGANFKVVDIGDTLDRVLVPDPTQNVAKSVAEIAAFRPHVIIILTPPALAPSLLIPFEAQIPDPKPIYISQLGSWQGTIASVIGNRDSLRKRYIGTTAAAATIDAALVTELSIQFGQKFPEFASVNLLPLLGTLSAYDSMFAMAYGIVGAGAVPIDGAAIATGMKRLTSGKEIPVGVSGNVMQQGFAALQGGSSILFKGTTGGVAFDETGQRPYGAREYCVRAVGGIATSAFRMEYGWSSATKQITGNPDPRAAGQCP